MDALLDPRAVLSMLKAAAEPTRLRILMLLAGGELNVKDLTRILGQSQPRISRHLKLLAEAGLIKRLRDGSWVYFQIIDDGIAGDAGARSDRLHRRRATCSLCATGSAGMRSSASARRRRRTSSASTRRSGTASAPCTWPRARSRPPCARRIGPRPVRPLRGPRHRHRARAWSCSQTPTSAGIGLDINHTMLAYARGKLDAAGLSRSPGAARRSLSL